MIPITVLLAEDHLIVREGLRALLKTERDIEIIAEAGDGRRDRAGQDVAVVNTEVSLP